MNRRIRNTKQPALWYLAIIIAVIIIPLYVVVMGYQFDISWYNALSNWDDVSTLYYVLSCIDIILFGYFVILYIIKKYEKMMQISVFCCLAQIILLITKVKY